MNRSAESAPSHSSPSSRDEAILHASDDILEDDDFEVMSGIADDIDHADDSFVELATPEAEVEAEATAQQERQAREERERASSEQLQDAKQALEGSQLLNYKIHKKVFNEVSDALKIKGNVEVGIAGIKRGYLSKKRGAQQFKYDMYVRLEKSPMALLIGKERLRQERRWAKRRLEGTMHLLGEHDHHYGSRDENGNRTTDQNGQVVESKHDKAFKEEQLKRRRSIEERRAKLLEQQIIAKEERRRRGEDVNVVGEGHTERNRQRLEQLVANNLSMEGFRMNLHAILQDEVDARIKLFNIRTLRKENTTINQIEGALNNPLAPDAPAHDKNYGRTQGHGHGYSYSHGYSHSHDHHDHDDHDDYDDHDDDGDDGDWDD